MVGIISIVTIFSREVDVYSPLLKGNSTKKTVNFRNSDQSGLVLNDQPIRRY